MSFPEEGSGSVATNPTGALAEESDPRSSDLGTDPNDGSGSGAGSLSESIPSDCLGLGSPSAVCECQRGSWSEDRASAREFCSCPSGTKSNGDPAMPLCISSAIPSSTAARSLSTESPSSASVTSALPSAALASGSPINVSRSGLAPGPVAGIAVGSAVAGAVIASLILFFACVRGRSKKGSGYGSKVRYSDIPEEKDGHLNGASKTPTVSVVETHLPQPAADDVIFGEFGNLRDRIVNHVQAYYHTAEVDDDMIGTAALHGISNITKIPASTLRALLLDPSTRPHALRTYIGCLVLSRATPEADAKVSLLPPEIAGCLPAIAAQSSPVQMALFSKWKAISGVLLQSRYDPNVIVDDDTRNPSIRRALGEAELVLQPFAANLTDERERNLEEIMRGGARFGFILFGQPSSWRFQWDGAVDGLAVFPRLLQLTNDDGQAVQSPRVFGEMEVVQGAHVVSS
ncbi:hypothetical protein P152DRAFT_459498 [Eremomyces bilateralis CBS 781.70]|uniref:Uncharacterized protein n=1 Tax=Eremomyces bilateralis CBS 781.70 TaxID=1392243 RepID=A0A6G1G163_9PEZI|nr:uncharacterized protein P152DRAFT_459498 [Eremomyces bilateralis CBS 781.70]KAF1811549.1 hypothetical protein P152DRAFT_459498 [Eremomyces bilateralis CBS 781.70]